MSENPILHSTVKGEGIPLLILHGYFGMSDNWKSLGNQFSEAYEVHLIDQRNHGRSFHEDTFNYEVLVEDLYRYIQCHQLENIYLIGHSMGGKTAMLFAVTYPELVRKLIVVDISPRRYEPHHNAILAGLNGVIPKESLFLCPPESDPTFNVKSSSFNFDKICLYCVSKSHALYCSINSNAVWYASASSGFFKAFSY